MKHTTATRGTIIPTWTQINKKEKIIVSCKSCFCPLLDSKNHFACHHGVLDYTNELLFALAWLKIPLDWSSFGFVTPFLTKRMSSTACCAPCAMVSICFSSYGGSGRFFTLTVLETTQDHMCIASIQTESRVEDIYWIYWILQGEGVQITWIWCRYWKTRVFKVAEVPVVWIYFFLRM